MRCTPVWCWVCVWTSALWGRRRATATHQFRTRWGLWCTGTTAVTSAVCPCSLAMSCADGYAYARTTLAQGTSTCCPSAVKRHAWRVNWPPPANCGGVVVLLSTRGGIKGLWGKPLVLWKMQFNDNEFCGFGASCFRVFQTYFSTCSTQVHCFVYLARSRPSCLCDLHNRQIA